jgi:signal peptidase II
LLTLIVDRLSKFWLVGYMADHPFGIEVTPFFNLVMVWNTGVSFGLFGGSGESGRWILSILALAITCALTVWLWRATSRLVALALGLVIGGALSNVIDRLYWGKVADFFDFHVAGYSWPAFNLSDSGIVVGVVLLLLDSLRPRAGKE